MVIYILTYMKLRTYVRTVDDVITIKPNLLASMGYQYFLSYGAPLLAVVKPCVDQTKVLMSVVVSTPCK